MRRPQLEVVRPEPSVCQVEALRFASTRLEAQERARVIRANGHAVALVHLRNGRRGLALAVVMRTFHQQALVLGLHLHQTERGSW